MALLALAMIGAAIVYFAGGRADAPSLSPHDARFVLFVLMTGALGYYAFLGIARARNRTPQLVVDAQGVALGFGRNRRFAWHDIEWVRLRRLALRPQLEIGIAAPAFVAADLRLSMWNFDDALRPIRGMPTAVQVRDNGLDRTARAMLDAVRAFRPNLVTP
jgi:hypothetical protein